MISAQEALNKAKADQARKETEATDKIQPILKHLATQIEHAANRGQVEYFTWLDETSDSSRLALGLRGVTPYVALCGVVLLEKPAGPAPMCLTLEGAALLSELRKAGYRANINAFPGGQLVVRWGEVKYDHNPGR